MYKNYWAIFTRGIGKNFCVNVLDLIGQDGIVLLTSNQEEVIYLDAPYYISTRKDSFSLVDISLVKGGFNAGYAIIGVEDTSGKYFQIESDILVINDDVIFRWD